MQNADEAGVSRVRGGSSSRSHSAARKSADRLYVFDGLRGAAAFVVIIYHYLCLVHPTLTPSMSEAPNPVVDTPLNLFVNGAFAVAIFFVLSGFVVAMSADNTSGNVLPTMAARYLRLAVPAAVSCVFAWLLLTLVPDAAATLAERTDNPSRWLDYTYQETFESPFRAAYNGMVGIFQYGYSRWNNALWTLKIELFGSLGILLLFATTSGRLRSALLLFGAVAVPAMTEPSYAAFALGAAIYQGHRKRVFERMIDQLQGYAPLFVATILALGLIIAFPGDGFHDRAGFPDIPSPWKIGESRGYIHGIAATLVVLGVLLAPRLARPLASRPLLWLGRVSFGLYLVHVPVLYTLVAALHLRYELNSIVILALFIALCLVFAELFTRLVDAPTIRLSSRVRLFRLRRAKQC